MGPRMIIKSLPKLLHECKMQEDKEWSKNYKYNGQSFAASFGSLSSFKMSWWRKKVKAVLQFSILPHVRTYIDRYFPLWWESSGYTCDAFEMLAQWLQGCVELLESDQIWWKFLHFGKILKVVSYFGSFDLVFGKILNTIWQIFNAFGKIFLVVGGKIFNK